jgi:hypothetical protein
MLWVRSPDAEVSRAALASAPAAWGAAGCSPPPLRGHTAAQQVLADAVPHDRRDRRGGEPVGPAVSALRMTALPFRLIQLW